MRVAILVEDRTHEAVVHGLLRRCCPRAQPVPGAFRGRTRTRRRKELRAELRRLVRRERCDWAVDLVDADNDGWHATVQRERNLVPAEYDHRTAIGAPERNIECWLSADPHDLAEQTGVDEQEVLRARRHDPKGVVQGAFSRAAEVAGADRHDAITEFVGKAHLSAWLDDRSFDAFWNECQQLAQHGGCNLPNLREAARPLP
jgi:hypothetical protein